MSRKFRWFLLAACAFVVVMNARAALELLAVGPEPAAATPERARTLAAERTGTVRTADVRGRDLGPPSELARGEEPER